MNTARAANSRASAPPPGTGHQELASGADEAEAERETFIEKIHESLTLQLLTRCVRM